MAQFLWSLTHPDKRQRRGCRRLGCLLLLLLLLMLLLCGLLFMTISRAQADEPAPSSIILIVDNSNSVFEQTDPGALRLAAVKLFATYLALHEEANRVQLGLIFFGSQAETAVPLSPITTFLDLQTAALASARPMGWTNPIAALTLARQQLMAAKAAAPNGRSAILFLTDGQPAWSKTPTEAEETEYRRALQLEGQQLAQAEISLFTILMHNEAQISQQWQPTWENISTATPAGRLFHIQQPNELLAIYHDLLITLTNRQTAGPILQLAIADEISQTHPFTVAPNLAQMTLLISKSNPQQAIVIQPENGLPLTAVSANVQFIGEPGASHQEIWVIDTPAPGRWHIETTGQGDLTVWEDYRLLPPPAATSTSQPTATPHEPIATAVTELPPPLAPQAALAVPTRPVPTASARSPAIAAQPTVAIAPPSTPPAVNSSLRWLWLLPVPVLLFTGGYLWHRRQRALPGIVSGNLFILASSGTVTGQRWIELDNLRQTTLTIGPPTALIPLVGATATVTIHPGERLGDVREMIIQGDKSTRLVAQPGANGRVGELMSSRSLEQPQQLHDSDHITIPPNHQLRYENLRLRAAQRTWRVNSN